MEPLVLAFVLAGTWAAGAAQDPPAWVLHRPAPAGYLVGIGIAQMDGDLPSARKEATRSALEDIALQVKAQVSGTSYLRLTEGAGGLGQEFRTEINTRTAEELPGAEIAGTYEDSRHCWVYARLSLDDFQQWRGARAARARDRVLSRLGRAQGETPVAALALYLSALAPLRECGDSLEAEVGGARLSLGTEIPFRIQRLLSGLRLEARPLGDTLRQRAALDEVLEVRASFTSPEGGQIPAAGLPLHWRFAQGEGALEASSSTGGDGVGRSRLGKVWAPQPLQRVEVRPDLAALLPPAIRSELEPQLRAFAAPAATIHLPVSPQRVFLSSEEWNLGEPVCVLAPVVSARLEGLGQGLVAEPEQADLVVELRARTRPGPRSGGIGFAFLDLELRAHDRGTGEEIYSAALRAVKGAATDWNLAGLNAYAKAGRQLEGSLLNEMLAQLNR